MSLSTALGRSLPHVALVLLASIYVVVALDGVAPIVPQVAYAPACHGRQVSIVGTSAEILYPAMDEATQRAARNGATVVYPNLDSCYWTIVTRGTVVRITFEKFDVEWSPGCVKDRLEIYQGHVENRASMLSVFCGTLNGNSTKAQDFLTPNGDLLLKFVSDAPFVRTGFKLKFDVVSYLRGDGTRPTPIPPVAVPAPKPIEPESLFPTAVQVQEQQQRLNSPATLVSVAKPSPKCNGRLDMLQASNTTATIQSPNFGFGEYYASDKCYWLIAAEPNKRIKLTFETFHIGDDSSVCPDDSVSIYSGVSSGSGLLGKYCGTTLPPAVKTPGRLALVVFASDAFRHFSGFRINYKAVDGPTNGSDSPLDTLPLDRQDVLQNMRVDVHSPGSADMLPGTLDSRCSGKAIDLRADSVVRSIRSPNFANGKYYSSDDCIWRLWTDPGLTIRVTITSFNLEAPAPGVRNPNSDPCPYDYLDVYEGDLMVPMGLLGHLCGSSENVGKSFYSRTSRILLYFHSDTTNEFGGFVVTFQVQDKTAAPAIQAPSLGVRPAGNQSCGGQTTKINALATEQYFNSPNYGVATYPSSDQCYWIIQAAAGQVIEFTVVDMELDGALPTCGGDSLKIYNRQIDVTNENKNRRDLLTTMCGPQRLLPTQTIRTTTNSATVIFKSDVETQYVGFRLSFKQTSPTPPAATTLAPFLNFAAPSPCSGKINTLTADEFRMGSFTSPGYGTGTASDSCAWLVSTTGDTRGGERIRLVVEDFDVGPAGPNHSCPTNYVQVFDGSSPSAPELGKFCGDYYYQQIISSGSALFVQYSAGVTATGRGFKISYKAEADALRAVALAYTSSPLPPSTASPIPKCNGHSSRLLANDKDWSSVYMPTQESNRTTYAPSDRCKWQVEAPIGFVLRVRFPTFHIESPLARTLAASLQSGDDCPDYVELYDGENDARPNTTRVGRFCGNTPPEAQLGLTEIKTTQRFAVVRFFSDAQNQWQGFQMQYKALRVPGTPTGPQPNPNFQLRGRCNGQTFAIAAAPTVQLLHSPNFDFGGYQTGDTCYWVVVAPRSDQRIQMVFTIMDIPGDNSACLGSYVTLHDGSSLASPLLGQFCSGNYPDRRPIYSTSQAVTVEFKSDWRNWLDSAHGKGFQMGYNIVSASGANNGDYY